MDKKTRDFAFSILLAILGIYITAESFGIYQRAARPPFKITEFYLSPGFMPAIIGVLFIFFAILLFLSSMKGEESFGKRLTAHFSEIKRTVETYLFTKDTFFTLGALLIMAVYTFILVELLPFWLCSIIFLMVLFIYLKAGKWWKSLIIAIAAVALVVFLFQICFKASLP